MAAKKSRQNPYQWPDGSWHSNSYTRHQQNLGLTKVTLDRPPAGTYDVGLDQQERAAVRGAQQTGEDLGTQGTRLGTDFTLGQVETGRQYQESLTDLLKQREQTQQDYGTNLQTLARNYQQLGNRQAQQGRQAGLAGGFTAQAARKRAANEAIERAPIDTSFNRFIEGSKLQEQQLGEARDRSTGELGLNFERGSEDIATQGRRTGTELDAMIRDIAEARQAQWGKPLPTAWVKRGNPKLPAIKPYSELSVATGRGSTVPVSQFSYEKYPVARSQQAPTRRRRTTRP